MKQQDKELQDLMVIAQYASAMKATSKGGSNYTPPKKKRKKRKKR